MGCAYTAWMAGKKKDQESLLDALLKLPGQVTGGTVDLARSTVAMTAMFGENRLSTAILKQLEPERLEAMAEAGHFLRDARETAGLSLNDLADSVGLADKSLLKKIESGEAIMPLEPMLRSASLLARHDPIPFLIKFMRTYNPALEKRLEQWGVLALPKEYERERRFLNLYRQHDILRRLSDDEFDRFVHYTDSSINLVLDVMQREKAAAELTSRGTKRKAGSKGTDKSGAKVTSKKAVRRRKRRSSG